MATYDYECEQKHVFEIKCRISEHQSELQCPICGSNAKQIIIEAPVLLTEIIPSYPGCKKNKAGYQHSHGDFSGTKVMSGPGGMINPKNQDKKEYGKKITGLS